MGAWDVAKSRTHCQTNMRPCTIRWWLDTIYSYKYIQVYIYILLYLWLFKQVLDVSKHIYIYICNVSSYAQTSAKSTFALNPCLFYISSLDAWTRSHMLSLQQKDGSFQGLTQLDILEHTAEISLELNCLRRNKLITFVWQQYLMLIYCIHF